MTGAPASGVIWLASYPKSGNTWLRLAMAAMRADSDRIDINGFRERNEVIAGLRETFDMVMPFDAADLGVDEILTARPEMTRRFVPTLPACSLLKTHDAYVRTPGGEWLIPPDATAAYIHVVRDPRDVALSFAAHRGVAVDEIITFMGDPDAMLARPHGAPSAQLPQPLGCWSSHTASWLDDATPAPLLLRYEDMVADLPAVLRRVAAHLGWRITADAPERAAQATRFDRLQAAEAAQGFGERPQAAARFFRSGRADGWRGVLTADQVRRIEVAHGAMMARLGY